MRHLGDITKLNGSKIPPVDCITFGSPCQGLSNAGLRKGLADERSGLFTEAVRVIKEMRRATNGVYPTFIIWENVAGAFTSPGGQLAGEDFRCVLEELARIEQPDATIPRPDKGKWKHAGYINGGTFSICWRLLDAQYWGVAITDDNGRVVYGGTPQRRKRIALVMDFGGQRAGVLLEPKGLPWNNKSSKTPWQAVAGNIADCTGASSRVYGVGGGNQACNNGGVAVCEDKICVVDSVGGNNESYKEADVSSTLKATHYKCPPVVASSAGFCTEHSAKSYGIGYQAEMSPTLRAGVTPAVVAIEGNGQRKSHRGDGYSEEDKMYTLNTVEQHGVAYVNSDVVVQDGNLVNDVTDDVESVCTSTGKFSSCAVDKAVTLLARDYKDPNIVAYGDVVGTLCARSYPGKLAHQDVVSGLYPVVKAPDKSHALRAKANCSFREDEDTFIVEEGKQNEPLCIEMTSTKNTIVDNGICPTLTARMGTGGNQVNAVCEPVVYDGSQITSSVNRQNRKPGDPCCTLSTDNRNMLVSNYIVRKLTPKEAERLQGYPDNWTNIGEWVDSKGKKHKPADSPRYKALGNSICLPQWWWLTCQIADYLPEHATLGSLFDGIGGFPLVWETRHGKGTAIWASEIEEFPIAVTKLHFPEKEESQ